MRSKLCSVLALLCALHGGSLHAQITVRSDDTSSTSAKYFFYYWNGDSLEWHGRSVALAQEGDFNGIEDSSTAFSNAKDGDSFAYSITAVDDWDMDTALEAIDDGNFENYLSNLASSLVNRHGGSQYGFGVDNGNNVTPSGGTLNNRRDKIDDIGEALVIRFDTAGQLNPLDSGTGSFGPGEGVSFVNSGLNGAKLIMTEMFLRKWNRGSESGNRVDYLFYDASEQQILRDENGSSAIGIYEEIPDPRVSAFPIEGPWEIDHNDILIISHPTRTTDPDGNAYALLDLVSELWGMTFDIQQINQSPYGGEPWSIPGRIEAEDFDEGGEGVAYHDSNTDNNGGVIRASEAVDIQNTGDTDGDYNIGWTVSGEWTEYTVNVTETGTYRARFRVAARNSGGTLRLLVNDVDVTDNIATGTTGDWQVYTSIDSTDFVLQSGEHVLRFEVVDSGFNSNWFEINRVTEDFDAFIAKYPTLAGDDAMPDADPDGDGLPSILEQWLASNPSIANRDARPVAQRISNQLRVSFSYDSSVTGSTLYLETSNDLDNWTIIPIDPAWVTEEADIRHIEADFNIGATPLFQRLRVE